MCRELEKWDMQITSLPPRLRDQLSSWDIKIVRDRNDEWLLENNDFWTWQRFCTQELSDYTSMHKTYTRSRHSTFQNGCERTHGPTLPYLLTIRDFLGGGSVFVKSMWPLIIQSCSLQGLVPMNLWTAHIVLRGYEYRSKGHRFERVNIENRGRFAKKYDQNTLCAHV